MTVPSAVPTHHAAFPSRPGRLAFHALGVGAVTLGLLLPSLAIFYWLTDGTLVAQNAALRVVAIATALLHLLPLSWGLFRLRVCLSEFAAGRPFEAKGISGLRDFALGTGVSAVAKPIAGMLFTLAMSWTPGPKRIAIEISSDVMILALFAGVVAAVAWAMERAAVLSEENRQFV